MATQECCAVYEKESVVRGHRIYKPMWTSVIGEKLEVKTEEGNNHNQHANAIVKNGLLIGHMPRLVAEVSWFFLKRAGSMHIWKKKVWSWFRSTMYILILLKM